MMTRLGNTACLRLAATPTFAIMALLAELGGSPTSEICGLGSLAPLSGMTFMYLLMSVFHSPPWLRVICQRSSQLPPRVSSREKLLVDKIHRPPTVLPIPTVGAAFRSQCANHNSAKKH
jgi:hypothetical protein